MIALSPIYTTLWSSTHLKVHLIFCTFQIKLQIISIDGGLVAESCPTLATTLAITCQAPLSMGFSRQEYWSGLPFPSSVDLPDLGIKPRFPALQADSLPTELPEKLFNTGILPSKYFSMPITDSGSMFRIHLFFLWGKFKDSKLCVSSVLFDELQHMNALVMTQPPVHSCQPRKVPHTSSQSLSPWSFQPPLQEPL